MTSDIDKDKTNKKKKIFVKPVFSYDQIVELIDSRISEIENASNEIIKKRERKKKQNKKDIQ